VNGTVDVGGPRGVDGWDPPTTELKDAVLFKETARFYGQLARCLPLSPLFFSLDPSSHDDKGREGGNVHMLQLSRPVIVEAKPSFFLELVSPHPSSSETGSFIVRPSRA
jgi:hypothetical protein